MTTQNLIARLREYQGTVHIDVCHTAMSEAADHIEAQAKEIERLQKYEMAHLCNCETITCINDENIQLRAELAALKAAPARVPLTDEQIENLVGDVFAGKQLAFCPTIEAATRLARAIEASHGIGANTWLKISKKCT